MSNNPNAVANLKSYKPGQSGNPAGRPVGIPNRQTILINLLLELDISELGVLKNKPAWYDKVKPKVLYELMTLAMAIKASGGDVAAYNALNKALDNVGGSNQLSSVDVIHIYKPEKLSLDDFNRAGDRLREKNQEVMLKT